MGVCCIVFDIDGMLLKFFMNFLNIEKKKFKNIFFSIFQFSSRFMLFPTYKKNGVKKNLGGGGVEFFFFLKTILSYFTFYAIFNITKNRNPPVCPSITFSLLVKWEVVSPNTGSR